MSAFVIKLSQQNVHMLPCARRLISERGAIVEHNQKKGEGVLEEMHRDPRLSVNVLARRMQNKKNCVSGGTPSIVTCLSTTFYSQITNPHIG